MTASSAPRSAPVLRDPVHALRRPVSGEIRRHLPDGRRDAGSQVYAAGDTGTEAGAAAGPVVPGR